MGIVGVNSWYSEPGDRKRSLRGGIPTVCEVVVAVPGERLQRVLGVLVGGEEAGVRRARARHHRRHAAHRPATHAAARHSNSSTAKQRLS